jgi:NADP-dependent 3-hydroxy acid dehydrogenase YdfG
VKLKPVRDQVVVFFGATSGIGRTAALRFTNRGARVVVSGRAEEALDDLVDEFRRGGAHAA